MARPTQAQFLFTFRPNRSSQEHVEETAGRLKAPDGDTMVKLSRRGFVAGSLVASAGFSVLAELRPTKAYAAPTVAPLRLLVLNSPYQVPERYFHPQVSASNSAMAPAGSSFYLSFPNSVLAPLAPFQSDLIIVRGLRHGTYVSDGWTSHASHATTLTGSSVTNPQGGGFTNGTSIDNYLYKRMGQAGSLTPIYAGSLSGGYSNPLNYLNGTERGPLTNPKDLYSALFANFRAPGSGDLSASQKAQIARRLQALAFSQKYLNDYQSQLSSSSQSHSMLQSHLASVQGLSSQISGNTVVGAGCVPPTANSITNDPGLPQGTNGPPLNPALAGPDMASFISLITEAFACDITRFATLDMGDCGDMMQFINAIPGLETLPPPDPDYHFGVTHEQSSDPNNAHYLIMAKFKLYFMNQAASMLNALKAIQDPFSATQTLYDNTVVLMTSEGSVQTPGADPHDSDSSTDQMIVIAGGCGGYFKRGQLLYVGGSPKPTTNHNALLTNIVNTFEKNQQDFNPAYVPNIINQYGDYSFSVSPTGLLA
jgi:hypothetical protein